MSIDEQFREQLKQASKEALAELELEDLSLDVPIDSVEWFLHFKNSHGKYEVICIKPKAILSREDPITNEGLKAEIKRKLREGASRPLEQMKFFVTINICLAIAFTSALILFVTWWGRYLPTNEAISPGIDPDQLKSLLRFTLITMLFAGATGGTLCNLRGLFKYGRDQGVFPTNLKAPFYIRPFTGAVAGLFTFFLGNLLTSALSIQASNLTWASLPGRLPYIALAFLAGFASQEFMERLKEVAKTSFSQNTQNTTK